MLLESSRVHRIDLKDIAEQRTDKIGINLLQLIALEEKKAAARAFDLVERVRERSTDVQWKHRMLDLIETIMVYKLPQLDRGEIQKMLNINDVELKKTRFYQDMFAEGELKGERKGEVRHD